MIKQKLMTDHELASLALMRKCARMDAELEAAFACGDFIPGNDGARVLRLRSACERVNLMLDDPTSDRCRRAQEILSRALTDTMPTTGLSSIEIRCRLCDAKAESVESARVSGWLFPDGDSEDGICPDCVAKNAR